MADPNDGNDPNDGAGGASGRPPVNPVRQKARFRRMAVLLAWWALVLIGLLLLTAGGPWWLILPVGVIGVLVVTNTIVIIRHTGPEEYALEPGRLAEADTDRDDAVAVWATRAPRHGGRDKDRRTGTLGYAGGRLTLHQRPGRRPGRRRPARERHRARRAGAPARARPPPHPAAAGTGRQPPGHPPRDHPLAAVRPRRRGGRARSWPGRGGPSWPSSAPALPTPEPGPAATPGRATMAR